MRVPAAKALLRRILMAAVAATLLVLAGASRLYPAPAGLDWSRSGRLLCFWSESGLYAVNTVYGGVVRLSANPTPGRCSPDGLKVAWSDERGTQVQRIDATGAVRVAEPGRVAGWSPDSAWVLVEMSPPGQPPDIYAAAADGSGLLPLGPHPAWDGDAAWSPDGRWVAFVSQREAVNSDIWVVGGDGSHLTRVTAMFEATEPTWSPDGAKLAFVGQVVESAPRRIYCLDFRTGKLTAVSAEAEGDCRAPEFVSPTLLRYIGKQAVLADVSSERKRHLPRGELAPGGVHLAALSGSPGTLDVITIADGKRRTIDRGVEAVAWSPDGHWLAYLALTIGPGGGPVRELRLNTPDARGVFALWSEGLRRPEQG